jgi:hypothetical protein
MEGYEADMPNPPKPDISQSTLGRVTKGAMDVVGNLRNRGISTMEGLKGRIDAGLGRAQTSLNKTLCEDSRRLIESGKCDTIPTGGRKYRAKTRRNKRKGKKSKTSKKTKKTRRSRRKY